MRVLALDHGSVRCGAAISDPTGTISTPLGAIAEPSSPKGVMAIKQLCEDRAVDRVVVGLPLTLSGEESDQTGEARSFAALLRNALDPSVAVELLDERLTTSQAQALGGEGDLDSRAAAVLLERWLTANGGVE